MGLDKEMVLIMCCLYFVEVLKYRCFEVQKLIFLKKGFVKCFFLCIFAP